MTIKLQIEDGWEDQLALEVNNMIMSVTRAVNRDAKLVCPVDTGRLVKSLIVTNPAPGVGHIESDVEYLAAVEFGDHGEQWVRAYQRKDGTWVSAHSRWANSPEQPFLRPSVYRTRDLSKLA